MIPCVIVFVTFLLWAIGASAQHFNLKHPMPYNRMQCSAFRPPRCEPPCPLIRRSGFEKAQNSPASPSATWHRGQRVTIQWHRNNHDGGFYRRSLVPVAQMFNRTWHLRTAFEWGCWSQGMFHCGSDESCGTDVRGIAHMNEMVVPKIFPDGDYVFSMVWYGGIERGAVFDRKPHFTDYYTCAFVRIAGGPLEESWTPVFNPGVNKLRKFLPPGICASSSFYVGECGGRPCFGNGVFESVPGPFMFGQTPPKRYLIDLVDEFEHQIKLREDRANMPWVLRQVHRLYCWFRPSRCVE